MADEIKTLLYKVCKATTVDEMLSYEQGLSNTYNSLADHLLENNEFYILNFEDIKLLHDLNVPMMSYFGSSFYKDCGVVFLEKYNPKTLKFLDLSILFYSLQILKWIKTDYWEDEVSRNLLYEKDNSLFLQLWNYFNQIVNKNDEDDRYIDTYFEQGKGKFYLDDDHYEEIMDISLNSFKHSKYSCLIQSILGNYRTRFTKYKYLLDYQPIFVEVTYRYLLALI
jgi:hypothetical protein